MIPSPALLLAKFGTHIAILAGISVAYLAWHKTVQTKAVTKERSRLSASCHGANSKAVALGLGVFAFVLVICRRIKAKVEGSAG